MNLQASIKANHEEFLALCKSHDVKELYAFGSSVKGNFNEETSDVDLLVELKTPDPLLRGEYLMDLWDKFELFFKKKVDLLTESSLRNPVLRKNINAEKVLIYDGKKQEISF
jgi:uncharacterized protein